MAKRRYVRKSLKARLNTVLQKIQRLEAAEAKRAVFLAELRVLAQNMQNEMTPAVPAATIVEPEVEAPSEPV